MNCSNVIINDDLKFIRNKLSCNIGEDFMLESKEVFYNMDESCHIQLDCVKELTENNKGNVIANEEEVINVLKQLENDELDYSNETLIDGIVKKVINVTENDELIEVLKRIFIMVDTKENNIKARAYPQYSDKSYFVEIGKSMYHYILNMSDVISMIILLCYICKTEDEIQIAHKVISSDLMDLKKNNNSFFLKKSNIILNTHGDTEFEDMYYKFSVETFEVAIAFLMGHEIGHHYYGHTEVDIKSILENDNIGEEIKSPEDPRMNELLADKFAVGFACEYLKGMYGEVSIQHGCGMYIPLLASALQCNPMITSKTHPSIFLRLFVLKDNMIKVLNDTNNRKILSIIEQLCEALELVGYDFSWWREKWMIHNGIPTKK